jgi:hypothetical protein
VGRNDAPLRPPHLDVLEPADAHGLADVEREVAVGVRGEEVQRRAGLDDEVQEVGNPAGGSRRGAADGEPLVDRLDGAHGGLVEPEVVRLRARPEDLEVRLVPDLEAPARDFLRAVALDEVRGERTDERRPFVPVARDGDARAVLEHRRRRVLGEPTRHERQLDDRPQSQPEHAVVDLVDDCEVVIAVAAEDREVVVQDRVGAHAIGAQLRACESQRLLEFRPDALAGGRRRLLQQL